MSLKTSTLCRRIKALSSKRAVVLECRRSIDLNLLAPLEVWELYKPPQKLLIRVGPTLATQLLESSRVLVFEHLKERYSQDGLELHEDTILTWKLVLD